MTFKPEKDNNPMLGGLNMDMQKMKGISLVEVLVALIVLGVGVMGVAKLQGISLMNSAESRMQSKAVNLAQEKIEELRHYATVADYDAYASGNDAPLTTAEKKGDNATFARTWSVTDCPNAIDCKQISVSVAWTGLDGTQYSVALTSEIAEVEPAKSGMVVGSVDWIGDTPEEVAAKAAAHAAAAAAYEAKVAASADATTEQKEAAAAARARAEEAAENAKDAADSGDLELAQYYEGIAAEALAEIIEILSSLPGTTYEFTGSLSGSVTSITVEDGTCTTSEGAYYCVVSTFEDEVSVTAINGDQKEVCQIDLTANPLTGCSIVFVSDCTSPWGGDDIPDGSIVTAYSAEQSDADAACSSQERTCSSGTLSGDSSYQYESCILRCTVPNYIGTKYKNMPTTWNSTENGSVINNVDSGRGGNNTAGTQSPTAETVQQCSLSVTVDD